jgi:hypothetical protein
MKTDRAAVARAVDLIDVTVHWRTHPCLHPTLRILAYRGRTKSDIDTAARTYRGFMSTRPSTTLADLLTLATNPFSTMRACCGGSRAKGVSHPPSNAWPSKLVGRYGALLPLFRLVGVRWHRRLRGEWSAYCVTAAIASNSRQVTSP